MAVPALTPAKYASNEVAADTAKDVGTDLGNAVGDAMIAIMLKNGHQSHALSLLSPRIAVCGQTSDEQHLRSAKTLYPVSGLPMYL